MKTSRRRFVFSIAALSTSAACRGLWADEGRLRQPIRVLRLDSEEEMEGQPVISAVAIDPAGHLLVTVGDDHVVRVWDLNDGTLLHELQGHVDWIRAAVFSPSGDKLLTAGNDRKILIWSVDHITHPRQLAEHPQAITALAFDPSGRRVAVAGFEHDLRIYDIDSREREEQLDCPCVDMRSLTFSPDGHLLVGGGRNGRLRIWDLQNHSHHTIEAHRQRIRAILFTHNGETIISSGEDRMIRAWNTDGEMTSQWTCRGAKVLSMTMIDENRLAIGTTDNSIRIWDIQEGVEIERLTGHAGSIAALDCRDGLLVSGSYDTTARVWDMTTDADHRANLPLLFDPIR